jgi:hypothetical protein
MISLNAGLPGDTVLIAPVARQIPCRQGILRIRWRCETILKRKSRCATAGSGNLALPWTLIVPGLKLIA